MEPNQEKAANRYRIFYLSVHLYEPSATSASASASADSLAPLLDEVGVGILLQTLGDVVADLDQTLPGVLQLLALRQALLGPVQLLQRRLHRPHSLLALQAKGRAPRGYEAPLHRVPLHLLMSAEGARGVFNSGPLNFNKSYCGNLGVNSSRDLLESSMR